MKEGRGILGSSIVHQHTPEILSLTIHREERVCNADGVISYDGPIDLGLCIWIHEFSRQDLNVRSQGWVGNTGDGRVNMIL